MVCDRSRLRAETPKYVAGLSPRWQEDGHEDVYREAVADARGMAQLEQLLERDPPPEFVYHEFALTDAAGHAYGPVRFHSDGDELDRLFKGYCERFDVRRESD